MIHYFDVCGVHVSTINLDVACHTIEEWIMRKEKQYVCVAPVSTIVDCQTNKEYLEIVNKAGMVTPDGMPLVWLGKLSGNHVIERTYGPDLMMSVCRLSEQKGFKHYLYGGTPEGILSLKNKLLERFPKLNIVGTYAPPFRAGNLKEEDAVIDQINQLNPDILWIGLGSPKQDFWMSRHRPQLNAPVMLGVGAAFDYLPGIKKQAPRWMQRSGTEWFFRLSQEPRRLWKRYLIGNTKFLFYITRDWVEKTLHIKYGQTI
jgi:N-acetylglucosaminyldiphosphoundecaprenol N-acetyl-beta-D-mannosaminyltransferase